MDLSIIQSVIPDFTIENFNLFDEIICLKWEMVFDDVLWVEHRNLILEMKSCTDYRIQMECKKVDSFRFRGNGKISGFYVKGKICHQWDMKLVLNMRLGIMKMMRLNFIALI